MKKRIVSLGLCVLLSLYTIILGSSAFVDTTLEKATEITRALFNVGKTEEELYPAYISSSYLKGLDGEEDYILSQGEAGGYAIYEKESMELIEYSIDGEAYASIDKEDRYYGGPVNHFTEENNQIKNINSKDKLTKKQAKEVAKQLKQKLKEDRQRRKELKKAEKQGAKIDTGAKSGQEAAVFIDADEYIFTNRKYIDKWQFFWNNQQHGVNVDGTCTTIATQLLLAYNNWANDGRLIPKNVPDSSIRFFEKDTYTDKEKEQPYSDLMRATNSSDDREDSELSFYEVLRDYINPYALSKNEYDMGLTSNPLNNGAGMGVAESGILRFFKNYNPDMSSLVEVCQFSDGSKTNQAYCVDVLKNAIDSNIPAIACIEYYESSSQGLQTARHSVVVYGYQTVKINGVHLNGFIANFGWNKDGDGNKTNIWFSDSWVYGFLYIMLTNHNHQDQEINENNHVLQCETCGRITTTEQHNFNSGEGIPIKFSDSTYDKNYHYEKCSCGQYAKLCHAPFTYNSKNVGGWGIHGVHCPKCSPCDTLFYEEHWYKYGNQCVLCNYNNGPA